MCSKLVFAVFVAISIGGSSMARAEIQWRACDLSAIDPLNRTVQILCGSLSVPLDYTETNSTKTADLPLLKISAANGTTKKASVLVNFGGPGENGTQGMMTLGIKMRSVIGTDHDLVTWHPRGTQGALLFSCYASAATRKSAAVTNPNAFGNASDVADGQLWSNAKVLADNCAQLANDTGSLVGMAFTARDMMAIVDALDEDGLLRYWGFSGGTVLGATAAAMFPTRVGAVVLDGVVNSHDYYHTYQLSSQAKVDEILLGFSGGCLQNPNVCPLAANHTTATSLRSSIFAIIDESRAFPITLPNAASAGGDITIDYTTLKSAILNFMYTPEQWPLLATILAAIIDRNASIILDNSDSILTPPPKADDESIWGITCGDKYLRTGSFTSIRPVLESLRTTRLGGDINDQLVMQCAQWPFKANERYAGNFDVKTRYPMLLVANAFDPATPLEGARNMSEGFDGSVLLEQNGYGHTSLRQASLCTQMVVREYFNEGTLPAVGTRCEVNEPLFPADGGDAAWAYVVRELEKGRSQAHKTLGGGK